MPRNREGKMDREALIQRVIEIGPWFHSIDMGEGIRTREVAPLPGPQPDDHPRERWADLTGVVPADLSGQRILDIGSADGFYTLEFARRGALEVVAVDAWAKHVNRVTWLGEYFGLGNITPVLGRIEELDVRKIGRFDAVFMLGLLYHLKDPLAGLEAVSELSDVLYLETISIFDDANPYLYLKPPQAGVHSVAKWIPTTRCIRDMLGTVGFTRVEEVTPPYHSRPKGRYKDRPIHIASR